MKKCFLLCNEKQEVLNFSDVSFKKCFLMILFRRHKNFMYHNLKLNVESTNEFGYHMNCLKKVITVKSKYKEEFEEFCKTQNVSTIFNHTGQMNNFIATKYKYYCVECRFNSTMFLI